MSQKFKKMLEKAEKRFENAPFGRTAVPLLSKLESSDLIKKHNMLELLNLFLDLDDAYDIIRHFIDLSDKPIFPKLLLFLSDNKSIIEQHISNNEKLYLSIFFIRLLDMPFKISNKLLDFPLSLSLELCSFYSLISYYNFENYEDKFLDFLNSLSDQTPIPYIKNLMEQTDSTKRLVLPTDSHLSNLSFNIKKLN